MTERDKRIRQAVRLARNAVGRVGGKLFGKKCDIDNNPLVN
jgi:hypothetical protein